MFVAIIGTLIIFYCVTRLVDTKPLYKYITTEEYTTWYDTIFIILILFWLLLNSFLLSGPISLIALIVMVVTSQIRYKVNKPNIPTCVIYVWLITTLIANIIIVMNAVYFKNSMWEDLFNLLISK